MLGFHRTLKRLRNKEERGSADVITMLMLLPILLLLIFSMIDLSFYLQTKSTVQSVTRDGARQVAMWGGNNSALRGNAKKPTSNIKDALQHSNGACKPSICPSGKPPVIKCSPNSRTSSAGQQVSCKVKYTYHSMVGGFSLFNMVTGKPFTVQQFARSETQGLR